VCVCERLRWMVRRAPLSFHPRHGLSSSYFLFSSLPFSLSIRTWAARHRPTWRPRLSSWTCWPTARRRSLTEGGACEGKREGRMGNETHAHTIFRMLSTSFHSSRARGVMLQTHTTTTHVSGGGGCVGFEIESAPPADSFGIFFFFSLSLPLSLSLFLPGKESKPPRRAGAGGLKKWRAGRSTLIQSCRPPGRPGGPAGPRAPSGAQPPRRVRPCPRPRAHPCALPGPPPHSPGRRLR